MLDTTPSQTALATAYLRAAHLVLDQPPHLFTDPLAVTVLGPAAREQISAQPRFKTPEARVLRGHVVLRARFTEDRLESAVRRGVTQYVVLGAGLDTFAFRQPAWARALRIFEIDHAATQQLKRGTLAGAGVAVPDNVTFGAIDFTRESLADGLSRCGVALNTPTFFSWLGVTMYLPKPVTAGALSVMGRFGRGSEVVLTYMPPASAAVDNNSPAARLGAMAASVGEPMISFFEESEVEQLLRTTGFADVCLLTPALAHSRYFADGPVDLPPPQRTTIAAGVIR